MYYVMRASAPSLHRESTDSLIVILHSIGPRPSLKGGRDLAYNTLCSVYGF